jgi:uncharacterized protein with FMN-binding domain
MITSELIHFVRARLSAGNSNDELRAMLEKSGWSTREINEVLSLGAIPVKQAATSAGTPLKHTKQRKAYLSGSLIAITIMYSVWTNIYGQPAGVPIVPTQDAASTLTDARVRRHQVGDAVATANGVSSQNQNPTQPIPVNNTGNTSNTNSNSTQQTTSNNTSNTSSPTPAPTQTTQTSQSQTQQTPMQQMQQTMPMRQSKYADGTYKGKVANAFYGYVQVAAVIKSGKLSDVQILRYPNDRNTSRYINSIAMPALQKEAIKAQSANVNIISGATDSSMAFRQSLSSALSSALN